MELIAWKLDDRDEAMIYFLVFCKTIIFETIFRIAGTQNQVPDSFSLEVPLISPE